MNHARQIIPANCLLWVEFDLGSGPDLRDYWPVLGYRLDRSSVSYHPLTYPELREDGTLRGARTSATFWLVRDDYVGTLPIMTTDPQTARAAAESWIASVRASLGGPDPVVQAEGRHWFSPRNPEHVERWGRAFLAEAEHGAVRLLNEMPWPKGLPRTHWHGEGTG